MKKMRIAVVGAGALGLYYGATLQRGGHRVSFLLRRDYEVLRQNGLTVTTPAGDFHLPQIEGYRETGAMPEVDLVLVGMKTFDNPRLVELLTPLMAKGAAVLTLQNGLGNEELLAAAFGAGQVLGGIAFLCANRGAPGTVHHLGQGPIRLGEFVGGLSPRAEAIAAQFSAAGIPCTAVADLVKTRWEKLVWNIPFNGLCALTRLPTDRLLAHAESRLLVRQLMEEVVDGANAQGLSLPIDDEAFITRMIALTEPMGDYHPSMMLDRLAGRPLELDSIYVKPLQRAQEKGVAMPRVAMLQSLLALGEVDQGD